MLVVKTNPQHKREDRSHIGQSWKERQVAEGGGGRTCPQSDRHVRSTSASWGS